MNFQALTGAYMDVTGAGTGQATVPLSTVDPSDVNDTQTILSSDTDVIFVDNIGLYR